MKHEDAVNRAVFSPDGKRVLTASYNQTARLWDAATGKQMGPDMKHERAVTSAVFSPDGKRVLTASYDKTACLWDATTGKKIGPL
jgi:WD40 repeat protein